MTVYPDMHQKSQIEIKNKKASFHYELLTKYTAGIVLYGTEIKSIREGKAGLVDSYCAFHEAARTRKLLLTKRELRKIERAVKETGLTIVPTRLYINDKGLAKLDIAVARGKKLYDKRESIKEKDLRRDMERYRR